MSDPIVEIESETVSLPLARPLALGPMLVREREYALLRLRTRSGETGEACCLTRGAPIAAILERLVTPVALGADVHDVAGLWRAVARANVTIGRSGLFMRALGLLDVAAWDAHARLEGQPLWQLLGGARTTAQAMIVGAYPADGRPIEELAEELGAYAAAGWRLLKVARDRDPGRTRALLRGAAATVGARAALVVDAGWAWESASEAQAELALWDAPPLAWLEDPLVPEDADGYAALAVGCEQPIGVGDEVTDVGTCRRLLASGAVDVLRIDVYALGGYTPALVVLREAEALGVKVSLHSYPETSVQLACAGAEASIETFDDSFVAGNPLDAGHLLWDGGVIDAPGFARAPSTPGLGVRLDADRFGKSRQNRACARR